MTIPGASREASESREEDVAEVELKNLPGVLDDMCSPSSPTQPRACKRRPKSPSTSSRSSPVLVLDLEEEVRDAEEEARDTDEDPKDADTEVREAEEEVRGAEEEIRGAEEEVRNVEEEEVREAGKPLLETGTGSQELAPDVMKTEAEGEEEDDGVPYDRGWAWMVVFGLFVNYILLAGLLKSSGLIFVELLRKFHAPVTNTAMLFAVRAGIFSVSGFYVMNILLAQYGSRKLSMTGAVLVSLSAILSSFANNLTLLICVHSVLLGVGIALLCCPGEVLVGHYFRRRRSLALGLAKCGASIGNVAVPPLLTYLLTEYGLMGTLLLYGGICLHCLPASMFFRPISYFKQRTRLPAGGDSRMSDRDRSMHRTSISDDREAESACQTDRAAVRVADVESERVQEGLVVLEVVAPGKLTRHGDDQKNGSFRPEFLRSRSQDVTVEVLSIEECDVAMLAKSNPEFGAMSTSKRKWTASENPESRRTGAHSSAAQTMSDLLRAISQSNVMRYMSQSSLDVVSSAWILQSPGLDTKEADHHVKKTDSISSQNNSCVCRAMNCVLQCPKNFIVTLDFSLFREPLFLLLMAYIIFYSFVNMVLDYLPAIAVENGVSESQSALLLSIIGGIDFLCRLSCGFIADLRVIRVSTMIAGSFVILGIVMQFVRFMTLFEHFLALAVVQGLFGGVSNCLFCVLVIDFVGLDNMGKGMGFSQLVIGGSMAVVYPFMGYIRDLTGSYAMTYHVIGLGLLVAAVLVGAEGPVRRFQDRRQRQKQLKNNGLHV